MSSEPSLPPTPRALNDHELQEVLDRAKEDGGGILAAMQILEAQAQLRETDKSELRAWQIEQGLIGSEEEIATALDEIIAVTEEATVIEVSDSFDPFEANPSIEKESPATEAPVEVVVQTKRLAKDPSSSQFWVWLPISGSLLPFGLALWLRSLGLSFAQSLTAALLGIFVSAAVVAVGAIAGKRSSLPTIVLSRAAFGVFGNLGPATILVLSRLFWALVLVILGYLLIAQNLTATATVSGESVPISWAAVLILISLVATSVVLSSFGGKTLIWAQRMSGILGILTAISIAWARVASSGFAASNEISGSWLRALGAAVVVFAIFGLAWSSASSDYASGLPVNVRGWKVAGWALLAMGLVPSALATLALLAFGNLTASDFASSFNGLVAGESLSTLAIVVQISLSFTLITTIGMSLRSSSMSFESVHLKFKPSISTPIIAAISIALAVVGLSRLGSAGFWFNLNGYALFLAVPVAAWSGIFVADVLIRRIAYHEVSLSRGYGFYKGVNATNTAGWLLAVIVGWGLLKSELIEFQWLGYIANQTTNSQFWSQSHFGVVIAFALGLLLPVIGGIPRIKRQEAEVLAIESRRNDLRDVLGLVD
jgi:NCS1 family nucleobase:cation symporter-1